MMIQTVLARTLLLITFFIGGFVHAEATPEDILAEQIIEQIMQDLVGNNKTTSPEKATYINDHGTCRNTQIISYTPVAGSGLDQLNDLLFVATPDTYLPSLEATINKQSLAVEYKKAEDGNYAIRVRVPNTLSGHWYVEMGAQSKREGACNDLLLTSFQRTQQSINHATGNPFEAPQSSSIGSSHATASVFDHPHPHPHADEVTVAVLHTDLTTKETKESVVLGEDVVGVATTQEPQELDGIAQVITDVSETEDSSGSSWRFTQGAALITGLSGVMGSETCNTFGSSWSWYMWMFVLWIYLIVVWFSVLMFAEPYMGRSVYKKRLISIVGVGTVAMIALWYCANPCLTHVWIPFIICLLGVILYWLYSEEPVRGEVQDSLPNNYVDSHYGRKDHYPKKKKKKNRNR